MRFICNEVITILLQLRFMEVNRIFQANNNSCLQQISEITIIIERKKNQPSCTTGYLIIPIQRVRLCGGIVKIKLIRMILPLFISISRRYPYLLRPSRQPKRKPLFPAQSSSLEGPTGYRKQRFGICFPVSVA